MATHESAIMGAEATSPRSNLENFRDCNSRDLPLRTDVRELCQLDTSELFTCNAF